MEIAVCGLSHRSASIVLLEKAAFPPESRPLALQRLTAGDLPRRLAFPEAVILSTCNRVEIYALLPDCGDDERAGAGRLAEFMAEFHGLALADLTPSLYTYQGEDAVRHLLNVAAGLDSLILGEPQILGQVREAFELALAEGAAGRVLAGLFRQALRAGKRVHSETPISQRATSVSYAAVEVAAGQFADLAACRVLIVGAGKTGRLAAEALRGRGVRQIAVANRSLENAQALAGQWGGEACTLEFLPQALARADIVVSCTNAPGYVISAARVRRAMAGRRGRPLLLIDIAVPRDIEPAVAELPAVRLFNLDDLSRRVQENLTWRQDESGAATAIVEAEASEFVAWFRALSVAPVITELREQAEHIRQRELERALRRLGNLTNGNAEAVEGIVDRLTQRIINQLLHEPTVQLKQRASCDDGQFYAQAVRDLFALDEAGQEEQG
jgi:glutamyl-tRNA reductase